MEAAQIVHPLSTVKPEYFCLLSQMLYILGFLIGLFFLIGV